VFRKNWGVICCELPNKAIQEANRDGAPPIELVDGKKLVEMFERVELGLIKRTVFDVDFAYFAKCR
jgi:restriction system protein